MRPATNNRKIVAFDEMDIFFKDGVGILLTKSKAIKIVRKGVKLLISIFKLRALNSKINGVNINNPPAGDGTPSKKLSLQDGSFPELTLNLANLKATQTT